MVIRSVGYRAWSWFFRRAEGSGLARLLWRVPGSRRAYRRTVAALRPNQTLFDGHRVVLDATDSLMLAMHGTFEDLERALFEAVIPSGATVLDIGGHIGVYTLAAARAVGPHGRVHVFEPLAQNLALLSTNVAVNGYGDRVTIHPCALSGRTETLSMGVSLTNTGGNTLKGTSDHQVAVRCRRADDLLGEQGVDVVKLDIEGAEPEALAGAARILAASPDLMIFTEVNVGRLDSVEDYLASLKDLGLDLSLLDEPGRRLVHVDGIESLRHRMADPADYFNLVGVRGSESTSRFQHAVSVLTGQGTIE